MTAALRPPQKWAHLPFHWLRAKEGHRFAALWQSDCWWTCGREPEFEHDHLIEAGVAYSHPCHPDAALLDPADEARLIKIACAAANIHLGCSYPECTCAHMPNAVRAVLAAIKAYTNG